MVSSGQWVAESAERHEASGMRGNRSSVVALRPNAPTRVRQHNLPAQLTSLIGRDDDIAELGRLLEERRLLTLIGTGGVGKTRLALAVATGWRDRAADGAWLVELASLSNPAFVPHAVAAALGLYERPDQPLVETIVDAVSPRDLLLVL